MNEKRNNIPIDTIFSSLVLSTSFEQATSGLSEVSTAFEYNTSGFSEMCKVFEYNVSSLSGITKAFEQATSGLSTVDEALKNVNSSISLSKMLVFDNWSKTNKQTFDLNRYKIMYCEYVK